MSGKLLEIKRTYSAKLFTVECQHGDFKIAGTLDGFIDLAIPQGKTLQLTPEEARTLAAQLQSSVEDIEKNCLYDRDALLMKTER